MAAGLKKDDVVILRIDGEDLKEFVDSLRFEQEAISLFSRMDTATAGDASLRNCLTAALRQLTVDHGMPPTSDPWVISNIVEPCLSSMSSDGLEQHPSEEMFLESFKKFLGLVIQRLQEHPVIVAHSENTFDGSGIKRLISNQFELDKDIVASLLQMRKKVLGMAVPRIFMHGFLGTGVHIVNTEWDLSGSVALQCFVAGFKLQLIADYLVMLMQLLDCVWRDLPKDRNHHTTEEYLRIALNSMAASANLPPHGAVDQIDVIVSEAIQMINADEDKIFEEAEFKKKLTEILGSIMLQLESNPVFVSSNAVVQEPIASTSTTSQQTLPPKVND